MQPNKSEVDFGKGRTYSLDKYGFLDPSDQWDESFAQGMARKLGIYDGLSDDHWTVIRYLRKKFKEENTVPPVVVACMDNQFRLQKLRALFPTGYHRGACKIAGLNYAFMSETNFQLTYENRTYAGAEHKLTTIGFLEDFEKWNRNFALYIASDWHLPEGVTDRHWEIIDYLRAFYRKKKDIPMVYETCKANNLSLRELKALFPGGYRRGACRIAGLPFFP